MKRYACAKRPPLDPALPHRTQRESAMSDLQIGLALLGALLVAAVVAFNWWQERQFRQRGEEAFSGRHDDVLLNHPTVPATSLKRSLDETRIEPSMEPRMEPRLDTASAAAAPVFSSAPKSGVVDVPRPEIDYIVEIRAGEFIAVDKLVRMQQSLPGLIRRISFGALNYQSKSWEAMTLDDARYTSVRVALQLVDRSGPVNDEQLRAFGDVVRNTASEMAAIAELPDFVPALEQAVALDEFCAEVDVLVGINVIANTGQVFHGTKIRALAEAAGLHLQSSGVFHCHDEHGGTLFSLDNQEPEPFLIDRIRNITTPGITFLLDVPRVANGLRVFDRMVAMSRSFADSLDGTLADDNRALLNDSGLDRIRAQLRAIYTAMEQRGIEAGSPLALRLFS
jgi:FtsZ-interacting cell division protein ZipA